MNKTSLSVDYLAKSEIHETWESDYLNPELESFYRAAFARMLGEMGVKLGDRILDAGCGYCYHASRLARAGLNVTGVDFSPAALEAARENLERQGVSIELKQGDLLDLDLPDGSFPFVMCWGVLMHIPELEKALGELARVTAPGGKLALSEINRRSYHVLFAEEAVLLAKRLLGRNVPRREETVRGLEEWREEGLLVRKLDIDWLVGFMETKGMKLTSRFSGQFTEIYTNLPTKGLKKLVYRFNQYWFDRNGSPDRAVSNIIIFEKVR